MRRAKLGDVYYVKVPNGYKLYQWAYSIPRKGDYIRVFDGLYPEVPDEIERIVQGPHSYIIPCFTKKMYQVGISQFIGNYEIPKEYPFPQNMLWFWRNENTKKTFAIEVMNVFSTREYCETFHVDSMSKLPLKHQDEKLINSRVGVPWILYLFDVDFDLTKLDLFSPMGDPEIAFKKYIDIVDAAKIASGKTK